MNADYFITYFDSSFRVFCIPTAPSTMTMILASRSFPSLRVIAAMLTIAAGAAGLPLVSEHILGPIHTDKQNNLKPCFLFLNYI